ncbi:flagellum-associated coiled-coil domain-containing protein 1, partial [Lagenorhynchus albirostris]|uniref:flagellum-associated coiled-coil domain-containing protein 1 n=1 Tax=Lagenorhynchus albirostris TaxID=27610 RepID=UPI0028EEDD49
LVYCPCWDPWNLGPRKLIETPRPPRKTSPVKSKLTPPPPASKKQNYAQLITKSVIAPKYVREMPEPDGIPPRPQLLQAQEIINVSPGYCFVRNREQICVTLGDEMSARKKHSESENMDKVRTSRTAIITDLEEQISELTATIEQMNRAHRSAQKLLANEMDLRCAETQKNFESKRRELEETHAAQLSELEKNYKAALKAEKLAAQVKLEDMGKEYKYLKNLFHIYQDSIYDGMEKWSEKKAEWEKEWEKILLQQRGSMKTLESRLGNGVWSCSCLSLYLESWCSIAHVITRTPSYSYYAHPMLPESMLRCYEQFWKTGI